MAQYRFSMPTRTLGFPMEIRAIIPDGVREVPTLWVLHGANCDCNEWFDQTAMARYLSDRRLAVIGASIHNGFGVNMQYGAPYADFLADEWLEAVRGIFPCLSRQRQENYVAGASMGGYAAFRLAVNRPQCFAKAGAFAGSIAMPTIFERFERGIQPGGEDMRWAFGDYQNLVNNENDVIHMARQCVSQGDAPAFYMFCGTEDFGFALNTIARDDLLALGAQVTWREGPGIHSFDCWDAELPAFLDWLEGKGANT